jgi:acetyl-CoA carboxylase carboxyl transferase subunit beta
LLIDEGTFIEEDMTLNSKDFLNFPNYKEKLEEAREKSRMIDAVISGTGKIYEIEVSIAAMEFGFMGGSMGSVVGEKITRTLERALEKKIPAILVASSGGARMQEGIVSLMQMAKTSGAVKRLNEAGIPFISVPVDPTTGGVSASFALLGDVIVTEPGALIGFAGPRVIEQTINQKLPKGFQKAEFLLEHGMVDVIAERKDLKETIYRILEKLV